MVPVRGINYQSRVLYYYVWLCISRENNQNLNNLLKTQAEYRLDGTRVIVSKRAALPVYSATYLHDADVPSNSLLEMSV